VSNEEDVRQDYGTYHASDEVRLVGPSQGLAQQDASEEQDESTIGGDHPKPYLESSAVRCKNVFRVFLSHA